jgi:hypothetical protein
MTNHIAFPSIGQFRNIIKHVQDNTKYHHEPLPTLTFTGTVKLHGTNHAVCLSPDGEMFTQSREHITTSDDDNAGSSAWSFANESLFRQIFHRLLMKNNVKLNENIQIFGEWCGGSIQKGVGLNQVPKQFIVFGIRISENAEQELFLTEDEVQKACVDILATIYDFPKFSIEIDFNRPELAQPVLAALTAQVEAECPVARQLVGPDFEGTLIGEGIVWSCNYKASTLRFKVKGEKHSASKVKVMAAVDVERVTSIREFVASVVTEARLTQGLEHTPSRDAVNTGAFIKWIMGDILKEEADTIEANGFTTKEVTSYIATAAREWFLHV